MIKKFNTKKEMEEFISNNSFARANFDWERFSVDYEKITEEQIQNQLEAIDQQTSSKIFATYSDNKQKNIVRLAMVEIQKALGRQKVNNEVIEEANKLNAFVEEKIKEGRDKKDKLKSMYEA